MQRMFPPIRVLVVLCAVAAPLLSCGTEDDRQTPDEYIQRATDFTSQGNLDAAIIELKNALSADPEHLGARWQLARVYLDVGRGADAEKELLKAREFGIEPRSITIPLGEALLLQGEYQRLLDEIMPDSVGSPRDRALILSLRGDAMMMLGKVTQGCELYEQSKALEPSHVPTYRGLAQCALAVGKRDAAQAFLDEALRLDDTDPKTWTALGNLQWFDGDLHAAMDAYSNALKNNPRQIEALFSRAQCYLLADQPNAAKSDADTLRKLDPRFFGADYVDAVLRYTAGNQEQALESIRRALSLRPDYAPARLLFAILSHNNGELELAAEALRAYVQQAPTNQGARKLLAATYLKLDAPDRAMEAIGPYVETENADASLLLLAGEAQLRRAGAVAAIPLFEQAAKKAPEDAALLSRVAVAHMAAGDEEQGVAELQAASALSPEEYRADIALAYQHLKGKRFDKALDALAVLDTKLPNNPGAYNLKGLAYVGKGDTARARENLEKALALKPTLVSAAIRLAQLDLADNDVEAAKGRYASVLKQDGNSIPAMVGLAELAQREGNEQAYLDWLKRGAAVAPSALAPRILLARYYAKHGDMTQALSVAREAADARPRSADAWLLLGDLQMYANDPEKASISFKRLVDLIPESDSAHYKLGVAQAAFGNEVAARDSLRKAIDIKPDSVDALRALHDLEKRSGHMAEATSLAGRLEDIGAERSASTSSMRIAITGATGPADQYKQALARAGDSVAAVKQHQSLLKSADEKRADEALLAWLAEHPEDGIARSYLAESFLRRANESSAIQQYEALLAHEPTNRSALNNLAFLYQRKGDARALPLAKKLYELEPDTAAYADTLGWILYRQGDKSEGLKLLEKASAGAPSNPEIRLHLAEILLDTNQAPRARQEIDTLDLEELDPAQKRRVQQLLDRLP